jgi:hypothetical protein
MGMGRGGSRLACRLALDVLDVLEAVLEAVLEGMQGRVKSTDSGNTE